MATALRRPPRWIGRTICIPSCSRVSFSISIPSFPIHHPSHHRIHPRNDNQPMTNSTPRRLEGKTALVTGSTRGLGRTIAEWLAREGADIIVSGREADAVGASVQAIRDLGSNAFGIPADLANLNDTERLATEALALVPELDILVNNAGMSIR